MQKIAQCCAQSVITKSFITGRQHLCGSGCRGSRLRFFHKNTGIPLFGPQSDNIVALPHRTKGRQPRLCTEWSTCPWKEIVGSGYRPKGGFQRRISNILTNLWNGCHLAHIGPFCQSFPYSPPPYDIPTTNTLISKDVLSICTAGVKNPQRSSWN